jgi:hypothetical protein
MVSSGSDSTFPPARKGRKRRLLKLGVVSLLALLVLFCAQFYFNASRLSGRRARMVHPDPLGASGSADADHRVSASAVLGADLQGKIAPKAKNGETRPFLELEKIVPFGNSLELVGRVEPGSRLVVNDEIIDVAGDGSYKYFTNPFPASSRKVKLVLTATDLAGRTRTLTATHDFDPGGENN